MHSKMVSWSHESAGEMMGLNDLMKRAGYDDWEVRDGDVFVYGHVYAGSVEEVAAMTPDDIRAAVESEIAAEQSRREAEEGL